MPGAHYFEVDISNASRYISEFVNEIYSWAGARQGDTWQNTGTLQKPKIIESVKRCVDPGYGSVWHEFTFTDKTSARCADNMGFGTIRVTGEKVIEDGKI